MFNFVQKTRKNYILDFNFLDILYSNNILKILISRVYIS